MSIASWGIPSTQKSYLSVPQLEQDKNYIKGKRTLTVHTIELNILTILKYV